MESEPHQRKGFPMTRARDSIIDLEATLPYSWSGYHGSEKTHPNNLALLVCFYDGTALPFAVMMSASVLSVDAVHFTLSSARRERTS